MKNPTYSFSIGNSCHESWQQMSATEQGRFCLSCQKEVIDFSALSDQEIIRVMEIASSSVCGRFKSSQLNRPMTMISYHVRRPMPLRTIIAGIALLTVLHTPYASDAASVPPATEVMATKAQDFSGIFGDSTKYIYKGRVLSERDSLPAIYSFISFNGAESFAVDSLGRFELVIPDTMVGKRLQFEVIDAIHVGGVRVVEVDLKDFNYDQEQVIYVPNEIVMMIGIVVPEWQMPKEKKRKKKDQ